jgi:hypothetical protein
MGHSWPDAMAPPARRSACPPLAGSSLSPGSQRALDSSTVFASPAHDRSVGLSYKLGSPFAGNLSARDAHAVGAGGERPAAVRWTGVSFENRRVPSHDNFLPQIRMGYELQLADAAFTTHGLGIFSRFRLNHLVSQVESGSRTGLRLCDSSELPWQCGGMKPGKTHLRNWAFNLQCSHAPEGMPPWRGCKRFAG